MFTFSAYFVNDLSATASFASILHLIFHSKKNIILKNKTFLFTTLFLFLFNCKNRETRIVNTAFHHWKSHLNISDFEQTYCTSINANTLYLRLFDVDFNKENKFPEPLAELKFNANNLINFNSIIPTVFITNRTLINTPDTQIDSLSTLIINKIRQITEGSNDALNTQLNTELNKQLDTELNNQLNVSIFKNKINALLIDCDWTELTRNKFFHLIKQLKTRADKQIITTIRLHQIKYKEKTGIPPSDKGLLMAYNTGDLSDSKTINSILDINILKAYIADLKTYPLELDVALPIFSWGIVKRDGQAVQLIPNCNKDFLIKNSLNTEGSYSENKNNNTIEILKNGYFNGYYLYADDVIKIEEIPINDLQKTANLLSQNINNKELTVSFFSLDSINLKRYNANDLKQLIQVFK